MKPAPTTLKEAIVGICDDLLSATGELGHLTKAAGSEWPSYQAATLIDRILDIRNQVSPPTAKPTAKSQPTTINGHAK